MITFTEKLNPMNLNFALNNSVFEFKSDSVLSPKFCTLEFNGFSFIVFPDPTGNFYYNLKDLISSLAGEKGFIDNMFVDLENDINYNFTDKGVVTGRLNITITLANDSVDATYFDLVYINGVIQVDEFKNRYPMELPKSEALVLNPLNLKSNRLTYLKYFVGYPNDFAVYTAGSENLRLLNNQTLSYLDFENPDTVERLVISDGVTDLGIELELSLIYGKNRLSVINGAGNPFELILDKVRARNGGHYFKWLNSFGGYSYWLFHKGNKNRSLKDLGEVDNDFSNLENTISPNPQIGKESKDILSVSEQGLDENEATLLLDMLESPAIFMFTGLPFARNNFNDWIGVSVNNSTVRVQNAKENILNLDITFELPIRKTRRL